MQYDVTCIEMEEAQNEVILEQHYSNSENIKS
jgi:hypothetical protein